MENLLPPRLIVELALLRRNRFRAHHVMHHHGVVVGEARKVAQADRVDARVRVLEPLADGLILGEYACSVAEDHVDGGHVAFAFGTAQTEEQILLIACRHHAALIVVVIVVALMRLRGEIE